MLQTLQLPRLLHHLTQLLQKVAEVERPFHQIIAQGVAKVIQPEAIMIQQGMVEARPIRHQAGAAKPIHLMAVLTIPEEEVVVPLLELDQVLVLDQPTLKGTVPLKELDQAQALALDRLILALQQVQVLVLAQAQHPHLEEDLHQVVDLVLEQVPVPYPEETDTNYISIS